MNCFWNMFDVVYSLPTCIKGVNIMYVYLLPTSRVWFCVFSGYKSVWYYVFIACKSCLILCILCLMLCFLCLYFVFDIVYQSPISRFDTVYSAFDAVFLLPIFRVWYSVSIADKWCWCCIFFVWCCVIIGCMSWFDAVCSLSTGHVWCNVFIAQL